MSVKLAHAIQSVKQWNKSAKEDMGTILFLFCWNKLIFIQEKHNTQRRCDNLATDFEFRHCYNIMHQDESSLFYGRKKRSEG